MSLFPFRYIAILLGLVVASGFYIGFLHYDHSKARCVVPRNWSNGTWHTFYAIGRLEFRVRDYGCDSELRLDPSQWKYNGVEVVPVDNASN